MFRAPLRRAADPRHGHHEVRDDDQVAQGTAVEDEPDEALVYLLFEHQSTVDHRMPFRLLRYMVRIWERWLEDAPEARRLPPIVPLVLYNGERVWRAPRSFEALVPSATGELARFTPHFAFLLTSLAELPEVEVAAVRDGVSRLALLVLRHGLDRDLLARLEDWADELLEAQVLQLLAGFLEYVLSVHDALDPKALGASLRRSLNPQAESTAMTVAEKLIEQGLAQGLQQGLEEGRTLAQRGTLRRLLGRRFGALPGWVLGAIDEADDARLEAWLDRVIDAETLDEVFAS